MPAASGQRPTLRQAISDPGSVVERTAGESVPAWAERAVLAVLGAGTKAGCSQCGQRTPVCAECGDSIIFAPKSGFGNTGEWQHLEPPRASVGHMARPRIFVDPPIRPADADTHMEATR